MLMYLPLGLKLDKKINPVITILLHVLPLLGNGHEVNNCTMAVTRQRTLNNNRGTVFSVRSVSSCYKQDKLGVVVR
jgi:hypothetical protein